MALLETWRKKAYDQNADQLHSRLGEGRVDGVGVQHAPIVGLHGLVAQGRGRADGGAKVLRGGRGEKARNGYTKLHGDLL